MSTGLSGAIIFGLLVALMLTGMPISIALGITVLAFLFTLPNIPIEIVSQRLFTGLDQFAIMAIPFFILSGGFLTTGGVARRLVRFATSLVGWMHGGLAVSGVLACAFFAAVSGSSPATVVAIGSILIPAMMKQGFPKKFGVGVIATSGGLGILVPPSIVMIIYAVSTNSSVGRLFLAGVVPGVLMAATLMTVTWLVAKRRGYPVLVDAHWRGRAHAVGVRLVALLAALAVLAIPPALATWLIKLLLPAGAGGSALGVPITLAWLIVAHLRIRPDTRLAALFPPAGREVWESFWDSIWGLLLIVVVIGGIYGGLFTPTEAAAVSAVYAGFVALVIYRDMPWQKLGRVLLDSANMSAMLLYIITNATLFSFLLTSEKIPQQIANWVIEQGLAPWMFLLFVNILLFFAGDFMEPSSIILILAPIFLPVAMELGIDPIHLGIIMTINMELGMITPPVGLNLYVASGLARMGLTEVTLAAAPWILVVTAVLLLVTYVPEVSLWLPNLVYGKGG